MDGSATKRRRYGDFSVRFGRPWHEHHHEQRSRQHRAGPGGCVRVEVEVEVVHVATNRLQISDSKRGDIYLLLLA